MKIEKELKDKWNEMYLRGDIKLISQLMPKKKRVSEGTIRASIRAGYFVQPDLLKAVSDFYKKREEMMKEL